jgi:Rap1a immunity proteins
MRSFASALSHTPRRGVIERRMSMKSRAWQKMRKPILALVATSLCTPAPATDTGSDNYEMCRSAAESIIPGDIDFTDAWRHGMCNGTVSSLFFVGAKLTQGERFCPPMDSTVEQALRVVVTYMERNQEQLHYKLSAISVLAMKEAWPCTSDPALSEHVYKPGDLVEERAAPASLASQENSP